MGLVGAAPCERLDTGHLVRADDVTAQGFQHRRIGIDGADRLHLADEGLLVRRLGPGVAPILATVRLEFGLPLKNDPPSAGDGGHDALLDRFIGMRQDWGDERGQGAI